MRKIDKISDIPELKAYHEWVAKMEVEGKKHPTSRTYYVSIVRQLYKCQRGLCAYTEMRISTLDLYELPNEEAFTNHHFGELEHFDPKQKEKQYWLWENLFMIHASINGLKSNKSIIPYLKPDLLDYSPEKYFDYDELTHRFIPNTDITDEKQIAEIQYMIDEVLFLNHGIVRKEREAFIQDIAFKKKHNIAYTIDRFLTAIAWCLSS